MTAYDAEFWEENFGDFDPEDQADILAGSLDDLDDLVAALAASPEEAAAAAHKRVSGVGNIGYLDAAEQCRDLEKALKAGGPSDPAAAQAAVTAVGQDVRARIDDLQA